MTAGAPKDQRRWEESFAAQIAVGGYNTSPVEAVVRMVAYHLRGRYRPEEVSRLHFLEVGCGAGPNLVWLARKGVRASGVDIAPTALGLARGSLAEAGRRDRVGVLAVAGADRVPFRDASFDGIIEACVFQHLDREDRMRAFAEVRRLLKPGGLFVGYMLATGHTVYAARRAEERPDDPGTLDLRDGRSKIYLTDIGLSHFYRREEYDDLLRGFSVIDPCLTEYDIPREEAARRGYETYRQSMWTVFAIR